MKRISQVKKERMAKKFDIYDDSSNTNFNGYNNKRRLSRCESRSNIKFGVDYFLWYMWRKMNKFIWIILEKETSEAGIKLNKTSG